MKKTLSRLIALAISASMLSVTAFAEIKTINEEVFLLNVEDDFPDNAADIYGVEVAVDVTRVGGMGSGFAIADSYVAEENFANILAMAADDGILGLFEMIGAAPPAQLNKTAIAVGDTVTITYLSNAPIAKDIYVVTQPVGAGEEMDPLFTIASVTWLDANGDAFAAAAPEVTETPAADETPAATPVTTKGNADTGVEDIAIVIGAAALAVGAIAISRKRATK